MQRGLTFFSTTLLPLLLLLIQESTSRSSPTVSSPAAVAARAAAAVQELELQASTHLSQRRIPRAMGPRDTDEELGMTQSLGSGWGWGGVPAIKVAWGDFQVRERRLGDGEVCQLTDIETTPPLTGAEGRGEFCRFVLFKVGRETSDVVSRIERHMHVLPGSVSYSGTKDKSAITCQQACIQVKEGFDPQRLLALNEGGLLRGVLVGNLQWSDAPLHPGEHAGNFFRIVARLGGGGGGGGLPQLYRSLLRLRSKKGGFINYFGHQRFGGGSPSAKIGRAIVLGHYKKAVNFLLDSQYASGDEERRAMELYEEGNMQGALNAMPVSSSDLRRILLKLCEVKGKPTNDDYRAALGAVGGGKMHQQAFWSLLWNRAASERLRLFGPNPVPGDLVTVGDERAYDGRRTQTVRILTEEDLAEGGKGRGLGDVVLPVVGQGVEMVYPDHAVGDFMVEMLREEGVYGAVSYVGRGAGAGRACAFRSLVCRPSSLRCSMLHYHDSAELSNIVTDPNLKLSKIRRHRGGWGGITSHGEGHGRALLLEFSLPPGGFATMCLRELFGASMHPWFQNMAMKVVKACEEPANLELELKTRDDSGKELSGIGADNSENEEMETEVEGDAQTFEDDDGL